MRYPELTEMQDVAIRTLRMGIRCGIAALDAEPAARQRLAECFHEVYPLLSETGTLRTRAFPPVADFLDDEQFRQLSQRAAALRMRLQTLTEKGQIDPKEKTEAQQQGRELLETLGRIAAT